MTDEQIRSEVLALSLHWSDAACRHRMRELIEQKVRKDKIKFHLKEK